MIIKEIVKFTNPNLDIEMSSPYDLAYLCSSLQVVQYHHNQLLQPLWPLREPLEPNPKEIPRDLNGIFANITRDISTMQHLLRPMGTQHDLNKYLLHGYNKCATVSFIQ